MNWRPRLRQTALLAVAVAVAAVVLVGGPAAPAGAETRGDGVRGANAFIDQCFRLGGDPVVIDAEDGSFINVTCKWRDGSTTDCWFWPNMGCLTWPPLEEASGGVPTAGGITGAPIDAVIEGDGGGRATLVADRQSDGPKDKHKGKGKGDGKGKGKGDGKGKGGRT